MTNENNPRTVDKYLHNGGPPARDYKAHDETDYCKAFNQGCDARLAGYSRWASPYGLRDKQGRAWTDGWDNVDRHWGTDVGGRWDYRPLPEVKR